MGHLVDVAGERGFVFDCGAQVKSLPVAFQTYGTLNADKSNAILICHGLTGDQYVNGSHPVTGKPGWWEEMVGPGKVVDTERYFIIATNVVGGCMGSFGPKTPNPLTEKPFGIDFPVVTICDMVRAQVRLIDALGIDTLFCVIGASMGGMQALQWSVHHAHRVHAVIPIATAARHSAQNIAFHEIGRQAIMADPNWCDGHYYEHNAFPAKGLAVARMTAHVTYMSEMGLQEKFGRRLQNADAVSYGFGADFQIESYLRHQGTSFVDRFDPNSYLYITRAMDYFDLAADFEGQLSKAFTDSDVRFCVISFSSDWCFPTSESRVLVRAINAAGAEVSFTEVESDRGHDAFLLDVPAFKATLRGFLSGQAERLQVFREER